MRMTKTKAEQIFSLVKPVNRITKYINYGGCGIFACILMDLFKSLGYKNVSVVGLESDLWETECKRQKHSIARRNVRNLMKQENTNIDLLDDTLPFYNHYMVRVGNYVFDSECFRRYNGEVIHCQEWDEQVENYPIGNLTLEELTYIVENCDGWNPKFNHRYIPAIKKYMADVKTKLYSYE